MDEAAAVAGEAAAVAGEPGLQQQQRPQQQQQEKGWLDRVLSGGSSTLALAFICNKALFPVRTPITLGLTPLVARWVGRVLACPCLATAVSGPLFGCSTARRTACRRALHHSARRWLVWVPSLACSTHAGTGCLCCDQLSLLSLPFPPVAVSCATGLLHPRCQLLEGLSDATGAKPQVGRVCSCASFLLSVDLISFLASYPCRTPLMVYIFEFTFVRCIPPHPDFGPRR